MPGDVLFGKLRPYLAKSILVRKPMLASTELMCLRPGPEVYPDWLGYLCLSRQVVEWANATSEGVKMPRTSWEKMGEFRVEVPPLERQRAIANFLDAWTARIDALIAKKRRMVDLLEERRSTFISLAVSGSLNPGPESETGNRFTPSIPRGWRLLRLKYVVEGIVDTAHRTAPGVPGGEYLIVRTANVRSGALVLDEAKYTDEAGFRHWTERGIPRPGDVLLTREAPAGEACLVPQGVRLCIGQRMVWLKVPRSGPVLGTFLLYSLYGDPVQEYIKLLSRSTTVAHLNMEDIPNLPIAVPPRAEQDAIVALIEREVDRVSKLVRDLVLQLSLLAEHRQALVTAAVMGDIRIPGAAA